MLKFSDKAKTRFEKKFNHNDGCWEWTSCKTKSGYGTFWLVDRVEYASRVAYTFYVGEIPKGLWVLHKCDNPGCVRPDHLFLGTHTDNMRDMFSKGRKSEKGVKNAHSRLSEQQVLEIRNDKRTLREIAADHGVHLSHIGNIKAGRRWEHV